MSVQMKRLYEDMEEAFVSSSDPRVIEVARRVMSMLNTQPPNGWTPGYQHKMCTMAVQVMKRDLFENDDDSDYVPDSF